MILEVHAIDTFYGETQALYSVSLSVANGEVLALLGANGAGKTTTLRSILGLTRPRRGSIRFSGKDITLSPTHAIARSGILLGTRRPATVPDPDRCQEFSGSRPSKRPFAVGPSMRRSPSSHLSST